MTGQVRVTDDAPRQGRGDTAWWLTQINVFGELIGQTEIMWAIEVKAVAPPWEGRSPVMKNLSISIASLSVATTMPTWVLAQDTSDLDRYQYGHMMWWGGQWYGMIFGPLIMVLVLALVIAVAVLFARWLGGPWQGIASGQPMQGRTPLDILKERFARGEIDKEEYEDRKRVLGD